MNKLKIITSILTLWTFPPTIFAAELSEIECIGHKNLKVITRAMGENALEFVNSLHNNSLYWKIYNTIMREEFGTATLSERDLVQIYGQSVIEKHKGGISYYDSDLYGMELSYIKNSMPDTYYDETILYAKKINYSKSYISKSRETNNFTQFKDHFLGEAILISVIWQGINRLDSKYWSIFKEGIYQNDIIDEQIRQHISQACLALAIFYLETISPGETMIFSGEIDKNFSFKLDHVFLNNPTPSVLYKALNLLRLSLVLDPENQASKERMDHFKNECSDFYMDSEFSDHFDKSYRFMLKCKDEVGKIYPNVKIRELKRYTTVRPYLTPTSTPKYGIPSNLISLDLDEHKLSSPASLSRLTDLKILYLGYIQNNNLKNPYLRTLTNLTHLDLGKGHLISEDVFSRLTSLQSISLGDENYIPGINHFTTLVNLTQLDLGQAISNWDSLSGEKVRYLDIVHGLQPGDQVSFSNDALKSLTTLTSLNLGHHQGISHEALQNLKHLRTLIAHDDTIISDNVLSNLTNLEKLDINFRYVFDTALNNLTALTDLNLTRGTQNITNRGFRYLTNLTKLSLYSTNMTSRGVLRLTNLTDVDIKPGSSIGYKDFLYLLDSPTVPPLSYGAIWVQNRQPVDYGVLDRMLDDQLGRPKSQETVDILVSAQAAKMERQSHKLRKYYRNLKEKDLFKMYKTVKYDSQESEEEFEEEEIDVKKPEVNQTPSVELKSKSTIGWGNIFKRKTKIAPSFKEELFKDMKDNHNLKAYMSSPISLGDFHGYLKDNAIYNICISTNATFGKINKTSKINKESMSFFNSVFGNQEDRIYAFQEIIDMVNDKIDVLPKSNYSKIPIAMTFRHLAGGSKLGDYVSENILINLIEKLEKKGNFCTEMMSDALYQLSRTYTHIFENYGCPEFVKRVVNYKENLKRIFCLLRLSLSYDYKNFRSWINMMDIFLIKEKPIEFDDEKIVFSENEVHALLNLWKTLHDSKEIQSSLSYNPEIKKFNVKMAKYYQTFTQLNDDQAETISTDNSVSLAESLAELGEDIFNGEIEAKMVEKEESAPQPAVKPEKELQTQPIPPARNTSAHRGRGRGSIGQPSTYNGRTPNQHPRQPGKATNSHSTAHNRTAPHAHHGHDRGIVNKGGKI